MRREPAGVPGEHTSADADVFVVGSGSTDGTSLTTPWTLCLDADERLTAKLVQEIEDTLDNPHPTHDGYMRCRRTIFMGRWLKHGGQYPA